LFARSCFWWPWTLGRPPGLRKWGLWP